MFLKLKLDVRPPKTQRPTTVSTAATRLRNLIDFLTRFTIQNPRN